jgi:hypothetical protein
MGVAREIVEEVVSGHLLRKYRETSAFLAYFRSNAAEFLCSSDWLAEGGGFELLVRFL